jgi:hypothetical protein
MVAIRFKKFDIVGSVILVSSIDNLDSFTLTNQFNDYNPSNFNFDQLDDLGSLTLIKPTSLTILDSFHQRAL